MVSNRDRLFPVVYFQVQNVSFWRCISAIAAISALAILLLLVTCFPKWTNASTAFFGRSLFLGAPVIKPKINRRLVSIQWLVKVDDKRVTLLTILHHPSRIVNKRMQRRTIPDPRRGFKLYGAWYIQHTTKTVRTKLGLTGRGAFEPLYSDKQTMCSISSAWPDYAHKVGVSIFDSLHQGQ